MNRVVSAQESRMECMIKISVPGMSNTKNIAEKNQKQGAYLPAMTHTYIEWLPEL
jgi:hypothetical protein